jgi:hypothetical protein
MAWLRRAHTDHRLAAAASPPPSPPWRSLRAPRDPLADLDRPLYAEWPGPARPPAAGDPHPADSASAAADWASAAAVAAEGNGDGGGGGGGEAYWRGFRPSAADASPPRYRAPPLSPRGRLRGSWDRRPPAGAAPPTAAPRRLADPAAAGRAGPGLRPAYMAALALCRGPSGRSLAGAVRDGGGAAGAAGGAEAGGGAAARALLCYRVGRQLRAMGRWESRAAAGAAAAAGPAGITDMVKGPGR